MASYSFTTSPFLTFPAIAAILIGGSTGKRPTYLSCSGDLPAAVHLPAHRAHSQCHIGAGAYRDYKDYDYLWHNPVCPVDQRDGGLSVDETRIRQTGIQ